MRAADMILVIAGFGGAIAAVVIGMRALPGMWDRLRRSAVPPRVLRSTQAWQIAWLVVVVALLIGVGIAGAVPSIGFDVVAAILLPAFSVLLAIMIWRVRSMSRWRRRLEAEAGITARGNGRRSKAPPRRRR
jgi:hypothetical protein